MTEPIDWAALATGAGGPVVDVQDVKAAVPIAFVLAYAGHQPTAAEGGELRYVCMFHDDSNPSLTVYRHEGAFERFKCWGCGAGGDVVDLFARLHGLDFKPALDAVAGLVPLVADWEGPTVGEKSKDFDFELARSLVDEAEVYAEEEALAALVDFLEAKRLPLDPEYLHDRWRIGQRDFGLIIPYFTRDRTLQSYKWRTATTKAMSARGSNFDNVLYGEWLDIDVSKTVVLTEGETDTWTVDSLPGRPYAALGLPTGASAHPKPGQVEQLRGRDVILALDGDDAGRAGAMRWALALADVAGRVRIATLPDGHDLTNISDPDYHLEHARKPDSPPKGIRPDHAKPAYVRPAVKEGDEPVTLSNWTLVPDRLLLTPDGDSFEGVLTNTGERVVLPVKALDSAPKVKDWGNPNRAYWYGTDRDLQLLKQLLSSEATFLPAGRAVNVAGLTEGRYVWPGGSLGGGSWEYVAGRISVKDFDKAFTGLQRVRPWQGEAAFHLMRAMHERRVTDPILAWLAAAPVRALLREFPVLAVTGASRSGKTTLLEEIVPTFSGVKTSLNLTATTVHALFGYVGSTNAFPVHFDEYRPGARQDTMERFRQTIRDAWTAQASAKGGMNKADWNEITNVPVLAPLVVSGEDTFDETSHVDRMALVPIPSEGKNPAALKALRQLGETGFAHAYLSWVQGWIQTDEGRAAVVNDEPEIEGLNSRQRVTVGVLQLGWRMLGTFLEEGDIRIGEPDFSLVVEAGREAGSTDPIREALLWALEDPDGLTFTWRDPGEGLVGVRTTPFVHEVKRRTDISLPAGEAGIRDYLRDKLGATERRLRPHTGANPARYWVFEASRLDQ